MTKLPGNPIASSMIATKFPGFLELPAELQILILRQYLIVRRPITARTHVMAYGPLLSNLARVSKYVHELATEIYYKENTFLFNRSYITGASGGPPIFRFPKAPVGHHIRTAVLKLTFYPNFKSVEDMLEKKDWQDFSGMWGADILGGRGVPVGDYFPSDFLVLIRPDPVRALTYVDPRGFPLQGKTHTHHSDWQLHCPNLKEIKINIALEGCMLTKARTALQELPKSAVIPMKAEKTVLDVSAPYCFCGGDCVKTVHDVLEGMLQDSKDHSSSEGSCGA